MPRASFALGGIMMACAAPPANANQSRCRIDARATVRSLPYAAAAKIIK